jgi:thiamine pyrophosphate-dependent acetolactate synthase large subunit-like protein
MAKKRVADVLVDTLVAAGVKRAYGLVGDSLNSITDSIRPQKELQWIPSGTRKRQRLRRSRRAVLPDA